MYEEDYTFIRPNLRYIKKLFIVQLIRSLMAYPNTLLTKWKTKN